MKNILFILILFLISFRGISQVTVQKEVLSEDNEFIFEMRLKEGHVLSDALIVYQQRDFWYLPIREMSAAFGLNVGYSPSMKELNGNLPPNEKTIRILLDLCQIQIGSKSEKYDCLEAIEKEEEVYVTTELLKKLFPVQMIVSELDSRLELIIPEDFPVMKKIRRSQKKVLSKGTGRYGNDFDHKVVNHQEKILGGFNLDQSISEQLAQKGDQKDHKTIHQTAMSTEFLGFETSFNSLGYGESIDYWEVGMKKVYHGEDRPFGIFPVKKIEAVHVYRPTTPLVGGGSRILGGYITNAPISMPHSYEKHTFRGHLDQGWDVELYQNGILIGKETQNETGQYEFKDVDLLYGTNRFKFVFFGPQGEEKEEHKVFRIGKEMNQENGLLYHCAIGESDDGNVLSTFKFQKNLNSRIAATATYSEIELTDLKEKKEYVVGELYGFADSVLYSASYGQRMDQGSVWHLKTVLPIHRSNLSFEYTWLNEFSSQLYNKGDSTYVKEQGKVEIVFPFKFLLPIRTRTEVNTFKLVDDTQLLKVRNRLGWNIRRLSLNNQLEWEDRYQTLSGKFTARYRFSQTTLRGGVGYEKETGVTSYEAELRNKISKNYDLKLSYDHQVFTKYTIWGLFLTKYFKPVALSFNSTYSAKDDYSVGMQLSYGLSIEPRNKDIVIENRALSTLGSASVFVFHDYNHNHIWDEGEPPLPGVKVRMIQQAKTIQADQNGIAYFTHLPTHVASNLVVLEKSLPDIQLRPLEKGYEIYPRSGSATKIDIPVGSFGDIDGTVYRNGRAQRLTTVSLIGSEGEELYTTMTDSEGFYIFEKIKPGAYTLRATLGHQYGGGSRERPVEVGQDGEYQGDLDLNF